MTSGVHRTHAALRPDELDDFLERGWYRIGSVLIASRYYLHDKELYSTVWTRLPLDGWRPRKGQRKRLARLRRRFDVQVVPFAWTPEHEALYDRYLEVAPGERSETLRDFLGGDEGQVLFETWAVEIRDDEKLVAFSLFDVGRTALQSLTGVYDPDYGQHGLGGMTLLLEAEHGLKHGYDWHYSGYVVPGADFMDYKWQLSEDMEFLHPEHGDWCHRQSFSVLETPDQRLKRRLRQVATALSRRQVAVGWRVNDLFSAPHLHEPLSQCLAEPLVLVLPRTQKGQPLIVWDDVNGELRVLLGLPVEVQRTFNSDPSTSRMDRTWIVQEVVAAGIDPETIAVEAQRLLR